ncbi:MAG: hypothetical protein CMJ85_09595 [Planctomycetes bacterium]|nr:hypothetical protein [Planctomycetota bacterium]
MSLRIILCGYIVRGPVAGMTWSVLQWVLGLRRLGHDVWYLEDSDDWESCYDPSRHITTTDPTYGLNYAEEVFRGAGLEDRWAYYDAHSRRWHGPADHAEVCRTADLLINISALHPIRPWLERVPRKAYVERDPGFHQIQLLQVPDRMEIAKAHDVFFTFGRHIAQGKTEIPLAGFTWHGALQPTVLDCWPVQPPRRGGPFSTVMLWDSYPDRSYGDLRLGTKRDSFPLIMDMPRHTKRRCEIALGGEDFPRQEIESHGWVLRDPLAVSRSLHTYQGFIHASRGELTIAKHGYAGTGWFSERSQQWMATGRPVITQDTGFQSWLPAGDGLFAFETFDQAHAAVEELEGNYDYHCRAARELAEEHFDSDKVLPRFIEDALA